MNEIKPEVIAKKKNQRCLHAFVVRARILSENIIKDNFTAWHEQTEYEQNFIIIEDKGDPNNPVRVEFGEQGLMPFVDVIAALAVCRPVFLQQDVVYFTKVFNAIKLLAGESYTEDHEKFLRPVLEQFQIGTYSKVVDNTLSSGGYVASDKDITSGWIYGFLLHDDAERKAQVPNKELKEDFYTVTYRAAHQVVAINTLYLYLEYYFADDARLFPDQSCWTTDICVPKTYKPPMRGKLYIADSNTPVPSGEDILSGKIPEEYIRIDSVEQCMKLFGGE